VVGGDGVEEGPKTPEESECDDEQEGLGYDDEAAEAAVGEGVAACKL